MKVSTDRKTLRVIISCLNKLSLSGCRQVLLASAFPPMGKMSVNKNMDLLWAWPRDVLNCGILPYSPYLLVLFFFFFFCWCVRSFLSLLNNLSKQHLLFESTPKWDILVVIFYEVQGIISLHGCLVLLWYRCQEMWKATKTKLKTFTTILLYTYILYL